MNQNLLQEQLRKELARDNIRDYMDYTFDQYIFGEWQDQLFDALDRVNRGKLKRLMVFMPPRTGKSELISKRFPTFLLGNDPKRKVVCASYNERLAGSFGRKARNLMLTDDYKNIFDTRISDEKKERGDWETTKEGGYYSVGVGGGINGRGFDIMIIDDPVKGVKEAQSTVALEESWQWYQDDVYNRQEGDHAAIIILMTRWTTEDLAGRLLEKMANGEGEEWEVISIPIKIPCPPYEYTFEDGHTETIDFKSFFPERASLFSIDNIIRKQENTSIRGFAALQMQDPIKAMGVKFRKEDFQYFTMKEFDDGILDKKDFVVGVFVDPAYSEKDAADYHVTMAVGKNMKTKKYYILDIDAGHYSPSSGVKAPFNMATSLKGDGWNVEYISVEDVFKTSRQKEYMKLFTNESRERGSPFKIYRFKPEGEKYTRILFLLEPKFDDEMIFFRADDISANRAWKEMEVQLIKFPAKKDDLPDTLHQACHQLDRIKAKSKVSDKELERKRKVVHAPLGLRPKKL